MLVLFILITFCNAFTVSDLLENTNYILSMATDNKNYVYYVVEENKNGVKTNVLYQTGVSNEGKIVIELATGVSKDISYSQALDQVIFTRCDSICNLYSFDLNMNEYQITENIAVYSPQITKNHLYFISPIFYGMEVQESLNRQKELENRKTTSHHVFTKTPFGEDSQYIVTDDDGNIQYKHLIKATITIDENGKVVVGEMKDISKEVGNVIFYDINEEETLLAFEGKSTAASNDKENYQKSSIYTHVISTEETKCISCDYKGHQMQPQITKKGEFIVFLRTTNVLEKRPAKYLVLYAVNRHQFITDKMVDEFQIEDYILGRHNTTTSYTIFLKNNRREAMQLRRAIYSSKDESWTYDDITIDGNVEHMVEVPCKDKSSCCVISQSFQYKPAELFYIDESLVPSQLSDLNDYEAHNLQKPVEVRPMGAFDDRIQALMYLPTVENPPVLLIVHDQEDGTVVDGFDKLMNPYVYTTEGYAVVMINSHVSLGYGDKIKLKGRNDFSVIVKDIELVINELKNYAVDTTKIGIIGLYGGSNIVPFILDAKLNVKAAAVHAPIFSIKGHYYTDSYYTYEYLFEGIEYENNYWFNKNNAMNNVGSYSIPTLISYGDLDFIIDKSQPISLFQALRRRDIKARLLRFPNSTNSLTLDIDIKVFYEQYLLWFKQVLNQ